MPELRVIGAALKGYDNIDVDAASEPGIQVTIVPDLLTAPTAELAIGLTIALGRHIAAGDAAIRKSGFAGWRPQLYGTGIGNSTVGIVGFGHVGQAIARLLSGFGCRIVAFDAEPFESRGTEAMAFEDVLKSADIVVLGLPLTETTAGLIDADAIGRMRPGALLVNPARGSLVDEAAVADALDSGQLGGYAADVFECEDWARPDRPTSIDARFDPAGRPDCIDAAYRVGGDVGAARDRVVGGGQHHRGLGRQGARRGRQQPGAANKKSCIDRVKC